MTQISWKNGIAGAWGVAANWTGNDIPNSVTADATVAAAGVVTLAGGTAYTVDSVTFASGTTDFDLLGTLDLGGMLASLIFDGNLLTLGGRLNGGTLEIDAGTLALAANETYYGQFIDTTGNPIDLNGHGLTLAGSSALSGTVSGIGKLAVTGTSTGDSDPSTPQLSVTLQNNATLIDAGTISGYADLSFGGSSLTDSSSLIIEPNAIYTVEGTIGGDIDEQSYIAGPAGPDEYIQYEPGSIVNAGLFDVAPYTGSDVQPTFINTGTVSVGAGAVLLFNDGDFSGTLAGAGEIILGYGGVTFAPGLAVNVATISIMQDINGPGSVLTLGADFDLTDNVIDSAAIALNGHNLTLAGSSQLDGTISGNGSAGNTLLVTGGENLYFAAIQNDVTLVDAGSITQDAELDLGGSSTTDSSNLVITAGAVYDMDGGSGNPFVPFNTIVALGTGAISNAGLFEVTGLAAVGGFHAPPSYIGAIGYIQPSFTNTGTLFVAAGDTMVFEGGGTIGGTLAGGGQIQFTSDITLGPTLIVDVAALALDGTVSLAGNTTLGGALSILSLDLGGHMLHLAPDTTLGIYTVEGSGTIDTSASDETIVYTGTTGTFATDVTGLSAGDVLELTGTAVSGISFGVHSLGVTTSSGIYDFTNVTYDGAVNGYTATFDADAGLEAITFAATGTLAFDAPATISLIASGTTTISGVSLVTSPSAPGGTYIATLTDRFDPLFATGQGILGSGSTALTISGSALQVNADLATLGDTPFEGADRITLTATDSLGGIASPASIAVAASYPTTTSQVILGAGATATNLTLGDGSTQAVEAYARTWNIAPETGAVQLVLPGGTTTDTVLEGGVQAVLGTANRSQINTGSDEIVDLSGNSIGANINHGGDQYVLSGGNAANTTIYGGGTMLVGIGATTSGAIRFAGPEAVLSVAGTILPGTDISGFDQNGVSDDAIILTGFTYAAGDTATLGAGGMLTLDLGGQIEKLDFNPGQSNAGHRFSVTSNSLDQVVVIDPASGISPNMDFLAPATAAGSTDVVAQILAISTGLIRDINENGLTAAAFQPALQSFAAIGTLEGAAASNLTPLSHPATSAMLAKLSLHPT